MANTTSFFYPYTGNYNYDLCDIAWGINTGDPTYYYSIRANNTGNYPLARYIFRANSHSRVDEVAQINYTFTGNGPLFAPGSIISVTGISDPTFGFTGMVLDASSGYVKYISAGLNTSANDTVGAVNAVMSPAWTTGFFFKPSYASPLDGQQNVITAKFEPGYEQRQSSSLNGNVDTWSLNFQDRSNKETRAIYNYIQDKAGVYSFQIMIPDGLIVNTTTQKFVGTSPKINPKSYNLNDVSVTVRQVFDV